MAMQSLQLGTVSRGAVTRRRNVKLAPGRRQLKHASVEGSSDGLSSGESTGDAAVLAWQRATAENRALKEHWKQLFAEADTDGNGTIDRQELSVLIQKTSKGVKPVTLDWLAEMTAGETRPTSIGPKADAISFEGYCILMQEYLKAFEAVDSSGNGLIGAMEVQQLFEDLGQPMKSDKLSRIMDEYDLDGSGQIDFSEFLNMFSNDLLDLQAMQNYIRLIPRSRSTSSPGRIVEPKPGHVTFFFGEDELDCILEQCEERLVVVEASVSWCRPCKGFEKNYEKFAAAYPSVFFTKFFGNSNESTKHLFTGRFKIPKTPTFLFMRKGTVIHSISGANKEKMEDSLQSCLLPEENPVADASKFKMQVWRSKLGIQ